MLASVSVLLLYFACVMHFYATVSIMHQSIPAVPIPPPLPPGNRGAFAHVVSPRGWGICNFIAARRLGICVPRGDPRAFHRCVFESAMDEFIGQDEAFVEQWLVRQGLEKLVDVLKVCFLNFRYFVITCKHINISDKVNYILFITKQLLTWTWLFCISHSKLA